LIPDLSPLSPCSSEAIRSVTHLVLAPGGRWEQFIQIEPKGTGGTGPWPVPSGPLFCSTVRIPVASGLVKSAALASVSFTLGHDLVSPAAYELAALQLRSPARPTRFCESRKRSVPVRVHSVSKSFGFVGSRHQAPAANPFVTHGTVESPAKSFLEQSHCVLK